MKIDLAATRIRDFALFPPNRSCSFDFEVFNSPIYETGKWCHGSSEVARGILGQGLWESYETRLVVEIFATNGPGIPVVLDFGANMGWYSVLASHHGLDVIAFEMEPETAEICKRNTLGEGHTRVVEGFIDENSPRLIPDEDVLFLKSDVEGSESAVIECCWDLIEARRVQYMMLEISPCFEPGYGELLQKIMNAGYSCFLIPNKRCKYRDEYSRNPLAVIGRSQIKDPIAFVAGLRNPNGEPGQENVLLRRMV